MLHKKSTGKRSHEETWQVKIRNHKDVDITVLAIEKMYGFWKIKQASHEYKQKDANTLEFYVNVPKDKEAVLEYTIEINSR